MPCCHPSLFASPSPTHLHHKSMHVRRAAVKDWNSRLSANITNHVLYTFFSSALKLLSSQKTHHSSSSLSHVYGSIHASKAQLDNIQNSFSLYTQLSIQLRMCQPDKTFMFTLLYVVCKLDFIFIKWVFPSYFPPSFGLLVCYELLLHASQL